MGKDKLMSNEELGISNSPSLTLVAEQGASLSSGSLRLYASPTSPSDLRPPTSHLRPPTSDLIVGCIDLYNYDPLNRRCAVGIMVATEHRRQGHALAMLQALEQLYQSPHPTPHSSLLTPHSSPLHTLYADIAATNTTSIALFRKAGYTQCGHFKEWLLVNDQYIDSIRMQLVL